MDDIRVVYLVQVNEIGHLPPLPKFALQRDSSEMRCFCGAIKHQSRLFSIFEAVPLLESCEMVNSFCAYGDFSAESVKINKISGFSLKTEAQPCRPHFFCLNTISALMNA